jgi:hypothetical protein
MDAKFHVLLAEPDTEKVLKGWIFESVHSFSDLQMPAEGQAWFAWKGEAPEDEFPGDVIVQYDSRLKSNKNSLVLYTVMNMQGAKVNVTSDIMPYLLAMIFENRLEKAVSFVEWTALID